MNKHKERIATRLLTDSADYRSNIEFCSLQYADLQNFTSNFLLHFFLKETVTKRSRAGTKL